MLSGTECPKRCAAVLGGGLAKRGLHAELNVNGKKGKSLKKMRGKPSFLSLDGNFPASMTLL